MMGLVIVIHIIVCALLIAIILIQSGRGGGLVENFSGIESMLGTKTNAFLTKTTTVLSVLFFITCLSLAFLSLRQSRSLMRDVKAEKPVAAGNVTAAAVVASNQTGAVAVKPETNSTK